MSRLRASRKLRFRCLSLSKLRSEGGFALIEVMVSAVLLVVISVASYPVIDQAAQRSSSNRARGEAVSLAEQDQDRMRAMPLSALANLNSTTSKTSNGTVFSINSKAEWTSDSTGTVVCSISTGAAQYLRVTTTITWPNMNNIDPVTVESIVSPSVADTNKGTVVVTMNNAAGGPQAGIPVTVQGSTKSTDAGGCAIWTGLAPGPSTVSFNSGGYLTPAFLQSVSDPVSIVAGQTSSKSYAYDQSSSFPTALKALVDGSASPVGWTAVRYVSGTTVQQRPATTATTPFANLTAAQASGFYPFTAGYKVYAGDCDGNDPTLYKSDYYSANPTRTVIPTPGASTNATAYMYRLYLTVVKNTTLTKLGNKQPHILVKPTSTGMTGCDPLSQLGAAGSGGTTNQSVGNLVDLPWGTYTICVDDNNSTSTKKKTLTANLNATPPSATPGPTTSTSAAPMNIDLDSAAVGGGSTGTAGTLGTGVCT